MSSILDLNASSDSEDDFDYIPPANSDSSYDEDVSEDEGFNSGGLEKASPKTKGKGQQAKDEETEVKSVDSLKIDERERMENLYLTFLSDVESLTSKKSESAVSNILNITNQNESVAKDSKLDTKPVPKIFEFAGETVTVSKDLNLSDSTAEKKSEPVPAEKPPCMPKKRGLDSVLGTIMNKNKKLNVLEKSSHDWNVFKKEKGLESELEQINKGKQGFIERQRFLERSDLRSFEMEKSMRQTMRKK